MSTLITMTRGQRRFTLGDAEDDRYRCVRSAPAEIHRPSRFATIPNFRLLRTGGDPPHLRDDVGIQNTFTPHTPISTLHHRTATATP